MSFVARSAGKASVAGAMQVPANNTFGVAQVQALSTGALPVLHKAHLLVSVASHFMHPVTFVKHSLPEVEPELAAQAVLAALIVNPTLHVSHEVPAVQVKQFVRQALHVVPSK